MKNIVLGIGALFMVLFFASCEKEEMIDAEGLPTASTTFLGEHFAGITVSNVKKEKEGLNGTEYTAYLQNGVQVKFDKNGNWEDVEAPNGQALPTSFIPAKIVEYVQTNYPSEGINSIDKERNRYDVELTNGLDLEFNSSGEFVKID